MISGNELRQILLEDADDAPTVPASELMTGIRHKVKVRRRARLAGAAAAIAVVVAASLAIVPSFVDSSAPEPAEPIQPRLEFPNEVGDGYSVVTSHVNAPGESEFDWVVELDWMEVLQVPAAQPYVFCQLPASAMSKGQVSVALAFNGQLIETEGCNSVKDHGSSSYPPTCQIRNVGPPAWHDYSGIAKGETFEASMWLQRGSRTVDVAGAQFGVAFAVQPRSLLASRNVLNTFGHIPKTCER